MMMAVQPLTQNLKPSLLEDVVNQYGCFGKPTNTANEEVADLYKHLGVNNPVVSKKNSMIVPPPMMESARNSVSN